MFAYFMYATKLCSVILYYRFLLNFCIAKCISSGVEMKKKGVKHSTKPLSRIRFRLF